MVSDYFSIGWKAASSIEALEDFIERKACNPVLIKDALIIASSCRDVCINDGEVLYRDIDGAREYMSVFFDDLFYFPKQKAEEEFVRRRQMIENTIHAVSKISVGETPEPEYIKSGIQFFNILYDGCLSRSFWGKYFLPQ